MWYQWRKNHKIFSFRNASLTKQPKFSLFFILCWEILFINIKNEVKKGGIVVLLVLPLCCICWWNHLFLKNIKSVFCSLQKLAKNLLPLQDRKHSKIPNFWHRNSEKISTGSMLYEMYWFRDWIRDIFLLQRNLKKSKKSFQYNCWYAESFKIMENGKLALVVLCFFFFIFIGLKFQLR